jgi:hypothetical protein
MTARNVIFMALCVVLVDAGVLCGQPPNFYRSFTELPAVPEWLSTPSTVRLVLPHGVRLELVTMTVISNDPRREAALIGVLRNRSRPVHGAVLTLAYVGADNGAALHSVPNVAYVSDVAPDGLLPFRFPLLVGASAPGGVTDFELSVDERVSGTRRNLPAIMRGDMSVREQRDGAASVIGDVEITHGPILPLLESNRLFVTLLLEDENHNLLDVLSGVHASASGVNPFRIDFRSFVPLSRRVNAAQVYVEVLP